MLLRFVQERPHANVCGFLATYTALTSFLTPQTGRGADNDIALPLCDVPVAAHGVTASERGRETSSSVLARLDSARQTLEPQRTSAQFTMVELPPDATLPGSGYKRPHHAFGYRWQAAESWLRDHGFDAQTCYLPMMRMHTKLSASGASGTLWVYGRCTFR
jgi:hypothetical protein